MGLFEQWPYTNLHTLNLDWILESLKELEHTIEQFVSINALKYADPIQWNIVKQYEKNTIVIDPLTGTAYISVQPVPSGVALTNTDYWTVVFDLGSFVTRAAKNFTNNWEDATTLTATFSTPEGEWLVWGDTLYKALVNITAGDQYVVDSNIEHFTIEELYNETLTLLTGMIGDLDDLATTDKSNIVAAINELVTNIGDIVDSIGDLNDLTTTDKTNIVAAIVEVVSKIGDLDDLTTTDKSNTVAAISEVNDKVMILIDSKPINVLELGIDNTGTEDVTQAINDALQNNSLYFPMGRYKISAPIIALHNIYGAGNTQGASIPSGLFPDCTRFVCDASFTGDAAIIINGSRSVFLKNFEIFIAGNEHGVDITPVSDQLFTRIDDVSVINISTVGFYINPTNTTSKPAYINNCALFGKQYAASVGVFVSSTSPDCMITRTWVMGIQRGILNESNLLILDNCHIWCGNYTFVDDGTWWGNTVGIETHGGYITGSNIYIDSPLVSFKGNNKGEIHVSNLVEWFDNSMSGSPRYDASFIYLFDNGRVVIDNGYIRATDRMAHIFDTSPNLVMNNVTIIIDDGTVISNSNAGVMPILKQNNTMFLKAMSNDNDYEEILCAYIPVYGDFQFSVNSNYDNITRFTVKKTLGGLTIFKYNESANEDYYYTWASNVLHVYRHTVDQFTDVNVTLLTVSNNVYVINFNAIRYANGNNFTRLKQADTSGLTAIATSQIMKTDWVQYGEMVTLTANERKTVTLPYVTGNRAGVISGIASQIVTNANIAIECTKFENGEVIVNIHNVDTVNSQTGAVTVFMAHMSNNI